MANILILSTGGTIASRSNEGKGAVAGSITDDLLNRHDPGIQVFHKEIFSIGSYLLTFEDLQQIGSAVDAATSDPNIDGVVITHGTDTMEETAFFLDLIKNSPKPVVLTGAQKTADSDNPDGPDNLREAITVAAAPKMREKGVLVSFAGEVRSARGIRKGHTVAPSPFVGGTKVAHFVGNELVVNAFPNIPGTLEMPPKSFAVMRVEVVDTYLGASPGLLAFALERSDAVVLAGTGVGNAGPGVAGTIASSKTPVILSSRVQRGPVTPIYGNGGGTDLVAAGAIPSWDLNPYQSRILAATLISLGYSGENFVNAFIEMR